MGQMHEPLQNFLRRTDSIGCPDSFVFRGIGNGSSAIHATGLAVAEIRFMVI
ncbi:predicted protein [Brucella sp. NVSL 07-0026]|nr:predicted protein [Brucella sp. NVSL 07-0026]